MRRQRPLAPLDERASAALARRLGIDTRALAAFRISLGLLLLADLGIRSFDLVAFYTDAGVLPRSALFELYPGLAGLSIHATAGGAWAQVVLFSIAAAFALALLVGYLTRLATLASLVLLASLHARNPVVLNAGDTLLVHLLFWGAFLPLGERWSVDALRRGSPRSRVLSAASVALLLQVVTVYTVNAAFKLRNDAWVNGEAIRHIFELDRLTVLLGPAVGQYPLLLELLDVLWLGMIASSVLLVLLTGRARILLVSLFVGAHVGMLLTLRLGLFPLISVAGLIPFLPREAWDVATARRARLARRIDGPFRSHLLARARALPDVTAGPTRPASRWTGRIASTVAVGALVLVLAWNAATLGYLDAPEAVESTIDPSQYRWDMFASAGGDDGWYVVPGELESGERIDALHHSSVRWDRPPDVAGTYASHRWLVYLVKLQHSGYADHRPHFAEYLCRTWNDRHEDELVGLTVYYVAEPTRPDGTSEPRRIELLEHTCSTDGAASDG